MLNRNNGVVSILDVRKNQVVEILSRDRLIANIGTVIIGAKILNVPILWVE